MANMLPNALFADNGSATAGSIFGGPFTGPDTEQSTGLTYFVVSEDVWLSDAISQLSSGAAPSNQHAYLVSKGNVQNVIGYVLSTQTPPNASTRRNVPRLHFSKGDVVFVRGVQLSGTAAEATQLVLSFSTEKPPVA